MAHTLSQIIFVLFTFMQGTCMEYDVHTKGSGKCTSHINIDTIQCDCSFKDLENIPKPPQIPMLNMYNISSLNLKGNRIEHINREDFNPYSTLKHLDLSWNRITVFPHGVFSDLKELKTLDIFTKAYDINNINYALKSFKGLSNLRKLNMLYTATLNGSLLPGSKLLESLGMLESLNLYVFTATLILDEFTYPISLGLLPNLRELGLGFDSINTIPKSLVNFVTELRLTKFRIECETCEQIEHHAFVDLARIETLHFKGLHLMTVEALIQAVESSSVNTLILEHVGTGAKGVMLSAQKDSIFCNDLGRHLAELYLTESVMSISSRTFDCLPILKVLTLSFMQISHFISRSTEYNIDYPSEIVRTRNAHHHRMHVIRADVLLPDSLEIVNLDYFYKRPINEAERKEDVKITESMQYCKNTMNMFLSSEKFSVHRNESSDISIIKSIWQLHGIKLKHIFDSSMMSLRLVRLPINLKCLTIKEWTIQTSRFFKYRKRMVLIDAPSLNILNMSGSKTIGRMLTKYTVGGFSGNFNHLSLIDLSATGLAELTISTIVIPSLKVFLLGDNMLGKTDALNPRSFQHMPSLEILNLSNNAITEFSPNIVNNLHYLKNLDLSKNSLEAVSIVEVMKYADLKGNITIHMEDNLFICSCQDHENIEFIQNRIQSETDKFDIACIWHKRRVKLSEIDLKYECSTIHIYVLVVIIMSLAFIVVLTLSLAWKFWSDLILKYYELKWLIKVIRRKYVNFQSDNKTHNDDYNVAYIIYDSSNVEIRNFVQKILVDKVENEWGMQLFIPERDAVIGGYKAENIHNDMEQCLCYIIVLSQGLLDDEMTDFSLQEVQATRRTGLRSRYCILRFGDAPRRHDIPKDLRLLLFPLRLMPVPILTWDEKKQSPFWKRLETFLLAWDLSH